MTGVETTFLMRVPLVWVTSVGETSLKMHVGSKKNAQGGLYIIETFRSFTLSEEYHQVPPTLKLLISEDTCDKIKVSHQVVKVPRSKKVDSFKLYFD